MATCVRCGADVAPDALRCHHCGLSFPALTDLGDRSDVEAVVGSTGAAAADGATIAPPPRDPTPTPQAGDTAPQPVFAVAPPESSGPPWRIIAAIGVVIVAIVGVVLLSTGGDGDDTPAGPPPEPRLGVPVYTLDENGSLTVSIEVGALDAGDRARLLADGAQVDEAEGPSPITMSWPGATAGPHRLIVQVRRGDAQTEGVLDIEVPPPAAGIEVLDRWIMQLASFEELERAERFAAEIEGVPDARVLASADWPSLRPGFFVVYSGPFETGDAVLERCRALGRAIPNDCIGRVISLDEADRSVIASTP
ncbi:MAG: SPOR domain-containing protein [Actinomycetota bacterium]